MTEPKYENFEDPKDYFSAKCDWLQARVQELEERLAAYTPLPGYNVIHSENTRLRERVQVLEDKKDNVWKRYDSALMENQRLREALECCADMLRRVDSGRATEAAMDFAMAAARDALKEKP